MMASNKLIKGINDIATTHPQYVQYFENIEDAYTHSYGSGAYVNMICPNCGYRKRVRINSIFDQRFFCPFCSDGISYAEKLFLILLKDLDIEFKTQYKFKNFNFKYDIIINNNIIVELHGKQHYEDSGWFSYNKQHENDIVKYDIAVINGFEYNKNYFVIDCRYSDIKWVKKQIEDSNLFNKLEVDIDGINWKEIDFKAQKSYKIKAIELWNSNEDYTTTMIGKELGLDKQSIVKYLKWGSENGLCIYNAKEEMRKSGAKHGIKIIMKDSKDSIIFEANSLLEMSKLTGISRTTIETRLNDGKPLKYNNYCKYSKEYEGCRFIRMEQ